MEKSLTKNSIFYLIYNILNVIFPFITGIYVARILLPEDIGLVETARNLATYFVIFSFLGIPTYGLREISKTRNDINELNKLYSELIVINTISTFIFLTLYIIIIVSVSAYRENIVVFLICGLAISLNFLNNSWLFEGLEKYDYISIRNLIFKIISLVLLFIFVKDSDDYLIYAFITVIGTAGNYFLNVINSKHYVKFSFRNLNLKRHMKSILYLVVVNLAIEIYSLVDITMLGLLCEKKTVTFYAYGMKIQKILLEVVNTFTMVLVPRIALYYKEGQLKKFNCLLTKTLIIIIILAFPIIIGIYYLGTPVITLIYGYEYVRAAQVLKVLIIALCISPIGYLLGSRVMLVTGHENKMIIAVGAGAIINIIGNIILIPFAQEIGAAFASILSEGVVMTIYILLSHRYFNVDLKLFFDSFIKVILALIAMIFVLQFFKWLDDYRILFILFQIFLAIIVYFTFLICTRETMSYSYYKKLIYKLNLI